MNSFVELSISYLGKTKLLFYEENQTLEEFYKEVQREFSIELSIQLMEGDAEITSVRFFVHGRKFSVATIDVRAKSEERLPVNSDDQENRILLNEIKNIEYQSDQLIDKINEWANKRKFKLNKSGGIKSVAEGFSRTLICAEKTCKFKLTFKSKKGNENLYELDEKLGEKNNIHSKFFFHSY